MEPILRLAHIQGTGTDPDTYPITVNRTLYSKERERPETQEDLLCIEADVEAATTLKPNDNFSNVLALHSEREIATRVISVEDDPSLNPWTFRAFFIGISLSAFGGSLAEIYYFKPQTVGVSLMFLAIISYVLGFAMDTFIPRHGLFRLLNPHPFNKKENVFIIIMARAAANSAFATDLLAVQRLYYNITPNAAVSVCLLFSSQLLGYGIGGMLRPILVYPSKMLYPGVLPLMSMLQAFFRNGADPQRRLKVFYIVSGAIFIWELVPEWIFPLLTGLSIACLAAPNNANVSMVFGGTNGNEGLGLLSVCFDWQYISSVGNPLAIPWKAQFSAFIGYLLCIVVSVAMFYKNIWKSQNFPLLSQLLFYENGTQYNQSLVLNSNHEVNPALLAEQGLPYFTGTWAITLLSTNMALGATFTHLLLWNYDDIRLAWSWIKPSNLRKWQQEFSWKGVNWQFWKDNGMRERPNVDEDIDPHYAQMLKYPDVPNSWYCVTFVTSFAVALVMIYESNSTLPWWSFVISIFLGTITIVFFGVLTAITGFGISIQTSMQMIAGYLHPGKPMANMYFVLFSSNTASQAMSLLHDLKVGQYAKLPPRALFTAQVLGTLLGAVLNYVVMNSIVDNQFEILLSVQGTNVWSGQQLQAYNSQAITWGGLSHQLFSVGKRYQWVPLSYLVGLIAPVPFWLIHRYWPRFHADCLYTPIICSWIGCLSAGINSSALSFFTIGFLLQWWTRTRRPRWFLKYNYLVAAALDGGTQVMVFILSFAVQGASGTAHLFPSWWGANQNGNYDRCLYLN